MATHDIDIRTADFAPDSSGDAFFEPAETALTLGTAAYGNMLVGTIKGSAAAAQARARPYPSLHHINGHRSPPTTASPASLSAWRCGSFPRATCREARAAVAHLLPDKPSRVTR